MIYATTHPATDVDWRDHAVCARPDVNEEFWYSQDFGEQTIARAICGDCPVRTPCLREGIWDDHGIWAAWTASERSRLALQLPTDPADVPAFIERAAIFGPRALMLADVNHPAPKRK